MKFENNKRVRNAYENYLRSNYTDLGQCYTQPSWTKRDIYDYWSSRIYTDYGCNALLSLKIIGFNSMVFSLGFTFTDNDKKVFCYITKVRVSYMLIDEKGV